MRLSSRLAALGLAVSLVLGVATAQDAPSVDSKIQDILTRMDRGGLATVWDRSAELQALGGEAAPGLVKKLDGASGAMKLGIAKALLDMEGADAQRGAAIAAVKDVLSGDGERDVKVAAAELLAIKGQRDEVKPLEKTLDGIHDPYVKLAVLKALKTRGKVLRSIDRMKELL